jgi:hypothetical protein
VPFPRSSLKPVAISSDLPAEAGDYNHRLGTVEIKRKKSGKEEKGKRDKEKAVRW